MSAVNQPMSISTNNFACPFKPCHSKFMIFHAKIGILLKYLNVDHTLFILYLEGNHTLFGEILDFIWKFRSGNKAKACLKMFLI